MRRILNFGSVIATGALISGGLTLGLAQGQQTDQVQQQPRQQQQDRQQEIDRRERQHQQQQQARQGQTHQGEVRQVQNNRITVLVAGEQFVFEVPRGTTLRSDGEDVEIQDVSRGDKVDVWFSTDEPRKVLLVTRNDQQRHTARRTQLDAFEAANNLTVNQITNMNVQNPQGENLGDIEEIVIDTQEGRIRYAVLSFGGFLGFGDKLFAIPWEALTIAHERDDPDDRFFILDVRQEQLEDMPGFDRDNWPAMADPYWKEAHQYHRENDVQRRQPRERDRQFQREPGPQQPNGLQHQNRDR
jgi:sporulation protein YlmC with PRC-barrel domain